MRKTYMPLVLISSLFYTTDASLRLLTQLYLKELAMTPLVISLSFSCLSLGAMIGSVLLGTLSDNRARRPLMLGILVTGVFATGTLALLLPALGTLLLLFLIGVAGGGLMPIMMAIVSQGSSSGNRGRNFSLIIGSRSLGLLLGMFVAGLLLEKLGFSLSFLSIASLPIGALCFLWLIHEETATNSGARKRKASFRELASLIVRRNLTGLYIAAVMRQIGMAGAVSLIFVYMASLGIPASTMGLVSASNAAIQILGMLVFGKIADRVNRKILITGGFCLSAFVPVFFAVTKSVWGMLAGYLTLGVAYSALYIGSTAHIGDLIPLRRQGGMLGLYESSRGAGAVIGPLVAGILAPVVGFQGMFLWMAVIAAIGGVFSAWLPQRIEHKSHNALNLEDSDQQLAQREADRLGQMMSGMCDEPISHVLDPTAAVRGAINSKHFPVALFDLGDNIERGGPGDATVLLKELIDQQANGWVVTICDPEAVTACAQTGIGSNVSLAVGGKMDGIHGSTVSIVGNLRTLHDGTFEETKHCHGGQRHWDQGLTAVVEVGKTSPNSGGLLVLNSRSTSPSSIHQITCVGIQPQQQRILAAKGSVVARPAYEAVCTEIIEVDTTGATTIRRFPKEYHQVRRTFYQ